MYMAHNNKGKQSFVSTEDQRLRELVKDRKEIPRAPTPPRKERTLTEVWIETNVLLKRIACALEGKVKINVVDDKIKGKLTQELKKTRLKAGGIPIKNIINANEGDLKIDADPNPPKEKDNVYIRTFRDQFLPALNNMLGVTDEGDFIKIRTLGHIGGDYRKLMRVIEEFKGKKVEGKKDDKDKWISFPYFTINKRNLE